MQTTLARVRRQSRSGTHDASGGSEWTPRVAWAVVWEDLKALNRWDERWAIEPATSPLTRLERWESPNGDAALCHVAAQHVKGAALGYFCTWCTSMMLPSGSWKKIWCQPFMAQPP